STQSLRWWLSCDLNRLQRLVSVKVAGTQAQIADIGNTFEPTIARFGNLYRFVHGNGRGSKVDRCAGLGFVERALGYLPRDLRGCAGHALLAIHQWLRRLGYVGQAVGVKHRDRRQLGRFFDDWRGWAVRNKPIA